MIEAGDLEPIEIPRQYEDAFGEAVPPATGDPAMPSGGYGQVLLQSVRQGEVLRFSMVQAEALASAGRDARRGERLLALKVDSSGQPRNLARGDYIDVLGEFGRGTGVMYVAQRLEVVRVGERLNSQPENDAWVLRYDNVTISVSPHDVLKFVALESITINQQFSIVVRADNDDDISITTEEGSVLNQELLRRMGLDGL